MPTAAACISRRRRGRIRLKMDSRPKWIKSSVSFASGGAGTSISESQSSSPEKTGGTLRIGYPNESFGKPAAVDIHPLHCSEATCAVRLQELANVGTARTVASVGHSALGDGRGGGCI